MKRRFETPWVLFCVAVLVAMVSWAQVIVATPPAISGEVSFIKHVMIAEWTGAIDVESVDMDKDGDQDIVACAYHATNAVIWWENDGQQAFTPHNITVSPLHGAINLSTVDLDQDGDMDVLAASAYGSAPGLDAVLWFDNDGNQGFTRRTVKSGIDYPEWLDWSDLDGDNDVDIVVTSFDDDTVLWLENDGNESFTRHNIETNFSPIYDKGPHSGDVIDLDRDGDDDIIIVGESNTNLLWWENDGSASFTKHTVQTSFDSRGAYSAIAADLDGDADLDLVSHGISGVSWYENDGNEGFSEHVIDSSYVSYYASPLYPADLDDDGDTDLVAGTFGNSGPCCKSNDEDIVWWENDGNGGFFRHLVEKIFAGPYNLFAADVDGDGDKDILGAADYGYEIAWWENMSGPAVTATPTLTPTSTPTPLASIQLTSGWNLVSLPLRPADTAVTHVLSSIAGYYDLVWAYDVFDTEDPWKSYNVAAPPFLSDLQDIDERMGIWINAQGDVSLTVTGTVPSMTSISLGVGWNLVGYPSQTTRPVDVALASIDGKYELVYAYDAFDVANPWKSYNVYAPPILNDLDEMKPNWGYWILVTEACEWEIPGL